MDLQAGLSQLPQRKLRHMDFFLLPEFIISHSAPEIVPFAIWDIRPLL